MKKFVSMFIVFALLFSFTACSHNTRDEQSPSSTPQSSQPGSAPDEEADRPESSSEPSAPESAPAETVSKSLVVYFSWSGNTRNVAEEIQKQTGSDIFEILPETPYSDDYNTVLDAAQEEQRNDARPAISGNIEHVEEYDIIYVGYPNWWGDMPMILYTFFDNYDLSGKTIAPFCTSGGSGLSNTVNEIKGLEPDATVTDGLHIGSSSASNPGDAVSGWLSGMGL